jgi:hypothetical protein
MRDETSGLAAVLRHLAETGQPPASKAARASIESTPNDASSSTHHALDGTSPRKLSPIRQTAEQIERGRAAI